MRESEMICSRLKQVLDSDVSAEFTTEQLAHLASCENCADTVLNFALEIKPATMVPEDFAFRVASALPAVGRISWSPRFPGLTVALILTSVVVVAGAAFQTVHPVHLPPGWLGLALASALGVEIGGIALWLTRQIYT